MSLPVQIVYLQLKIGNSERKKPDLFDIVDSGCRPGPQILYQDELLCR